VIDRFVVRGQLDAIFDFRRAQVIELLGAP